MSEHDRSCVFSREPQLYDVRYPPGKHFTVKGVLTFIHLGPRDGTTSHSMHFAVPTCTAMRRRWPC
jgi:hypothetical protein